jgi:hypothetical protein
MGGEKLLLGSDDAKLAFYDSGELKYEMTFIHGTKNEMRAVDTIIPFTKGFVCGGKDGAVTVYERCDDQKEFAFRKIKDFTLGDETSKVVNLALSANEDNLLASLESTQVYFINFGSTEIIKVIYCRLT